MNAITYSIGNTRTWATMPFSIGAPQVLSSGLGPIVVREYIRIKGSYVDTLKLEGSSMDTLKVEGSHVTTLKFEGNYVDTLKVKGSYEDTIKVEGDVG